MFPVDSGRLEQEIQRLRQAIEAAKARALKNPFRNVIDPFSALVDASTQGVPLDSWMEQEVARQCQKSFQNALGAFHQNVIGAIPGWEDAGPDGSFDVRNREMGIIAEVKNKYNTLNSTAKLGTYDKLSRYLDYGDGNEVAYVVVIVPRSRRPFKRPFMARERGSPRLPRQDLLSIDGASFYDLATGVKGSLRMLYEHLAHQLGATDSDPQNSSWFHPIFNRAYGAPPSGTVR